MTTRKGQTMSNAMRRLTAILATLVASGVFAPTAFAGDLTANIVNPFICDGASKPLGTLSGAQPGEQITFTSPDTGDEPLLSGVANGSGQLNLIWQCEPDEQGLSWEVTARGSASGNSGIFVVNPNQRWARTVPKKPKKGLSRGNPTSWNSWNAKYGYRAKGALIRLASATSTKLPIPSSLTLKCPEPPAWPRPKSQNPKKSWGPNALELKFRAAIATLKGTAQWNAARLASHYLGRTGNRTWVSMPDLIWDQRPLWASLEFHLRNEASQAWNSLKSVASDGVIFTDLDSGWQVYEVKNKGDWYNALHGLSFRVIGQMYVGPARPIGGREIQIVYRSCLSDVYDFAGAGKGGFGEFRALHDQGRAAEFLVSGDTVPRDVLQQSSIFNPWKLAFRW